MTKHFKWMRLVPGQIEVSTGYNAFVDHLDEMLFGILMVFPYLFEDGYEGLNVSINPNGLIVDGGFAIVNGIPFAMTESLLLTPTIQKGFVVLRVRDKVYIETSDETGADLSIASFDLDNQTVTQIRKPLKPTIKTIKDDDMVNLWDKIIFIDASEKDVLLSLPQATQAANRIYIVKRIDNSSNTSKILPIGGARIDGQPFYILLNMEKITVVSDGVDWWLI